MGVLLLVIILGALFTVMYVATKKDICSPGVLFTGSFFMATVAAALNTKYWGVDLCFTTMLIILVGVLSFIITELFIRTIYANRGMKPSVLDWENTEVSISPGKLLFMSLLSILVVYLQYKEIMRIYVYADSYYINLGIMTAYKNALLNEQEITEWVEQLTKVVTVSGYIYVFVIIYNYFFCDHWVRKSVRYVVPLGAYIVLCFLRGGRGSFILLAAFSICIIYYFIKQKNNWSSFVSDSFIRKAVMFIAIFFLFFYFSKGLVGRVSEEGFFEYMTKYIGGSIELLDLYIKNPKDGTDIFLSNTIPGFYNSIRKIGIVDIPVLQISYEFRSSTTNILIGNVYSCFRRYYQDLQWIGVIVFPMIMSWIYNVVYIKIKRSRYISHRLIFTMFIYASNIGLLVMQGMEDLFFTSKFSIGYLIEVIFLYLMLKFLIRITPQNR